MFLKKSLVHSFQCVSYLAHCSPCRVELSGVFPAPLAYFLPGESSFLPSAESFLALSFCFPLLKLPVAASSFVAVQTISNHLQLDLRKIKFWWEVWVCVEGKAVGPKGEIQVYQFMVRKVAFIFFQQYFHFICNESCINSLDTFFVLQAMLILTFSFKWNNWYHMLASLSFDLIWLFIFKSV